MKELIVMAERMKMLQAEKEAAEETLKGINKDLDNLRLKLIPEWMSENDVRSTTLEGIGRVQLASDAYVSIIADKKAEAYDWLEEHGYGGIIAPYAQPSTLKATVKEAMKKGQEWPVELFNVTPFMRASIVKA